MTKLRGCHDVLMKAMIRFVDEAHVAPGSSRVHVVDTCFKVLDVTRGEVLGQSFESFTFKNQAHRDEHLAQLLFRNVEYEGPSIREVLDKSLALKLTQGLPDRPGAHAVVFAEPILSQSLAGSQHSRHDCLPQPVRHLLTNRTCGSTCVDLAKSGPLHTPSTRSRGST